MAAQRVLVVLLSCTALFAAGFGQKISMGQLTSNGKPIGDVYAISRKTMRVENFNLDLSEAGTDVVWMFGHTGTPNDIGTVATFFFLENDQRASPQMMVVMGNKIFKNATLIMNVPPLMGPCGEDGYIWLKLIDMSNTTDLAVLAMSKDRMENMIREMCPTPPSLSCSNKTDADGEPNFTCKKLTNGYGMCWAERNKFGHFVLCANDIGPGQYMAFGWSRKVRKTTMDKSDAVVCSHHINGTWDVEDYYLESRHPCGTKQEGQTVGVCPDTAFGGSSNILSTDAQYVDSVGYCRFRRRLYTDRMHDMKVTVQKQQAIVWAIGPIGADSQIQKHSTRPGDTQFFSFVDKGQQCGLGDPYCCCNNIIREQGE